MSAEGVETGSPGMSRGPSDQDDLVTCLVRGRYCFVVDQVILFSFTRVRYYDINIDLYKLELKNSHFLKQNKGKLKQVS